MARYKVTFIYETYVGNVADELDAIETVYSEVNKNFADKAKAKVELISE